MRVDRLLVLGAGSVIALALFALNDPDNGLMTLVTVQNLLWLVIGATLVYWLRRGLMDGARSKAAYLKALETATGAGLAFVGLCVLTGLLMLCFTLLITSARAAGINDNAKLYLPQLIAEEASYWPGISNGHTLAGLVEQESSWNPKAELKMTREYGFGLGQITITPRFNNFEEARRLDRSLADWKWEDRFDTRKQLRTMVLTQKKNWRLTSYAATVDDHWAFTLNAYNGGFGGLQLDRRLCASINRCDPSRWFGHVADHSTKSRTPAIGYSKSFYQISREYPVLIFQRREKYRRYFA